MAAFGMSLGYKVRGQDDELALQRMQVAFERTGEGFEKFGEKFFPKLSGLLEDEIKSQFDAEGRGPNRGRWKPLSEPYAAWKTQAFPGQPTLVATGAMRDALTRASAAHALRAESGSQFNFGTHGLEFASFHQTGTTRMPDRPPFDFSDKLERGIRQKAAETAREIAKESGVDEFVGEP